MSEPVSLADIKAHLRLNASATGEDEYLAGLLLAARGACEARLNRTFSDQDFAPSDLAMLGHAIRLTVGNWYANREAAISTQGGIAELPMGVTWILEPMRRIAQPALPA